MLMHRRTRLTYTQARAHTNKNTSLRHPPTNTYLVMGKIRQRNGAMSLDDALTHAARLKSDTGLCMCVLVHTHARDLVRTSPRLLARSITHIGTRMRAYAHNYTFIQKIV